MLNKNKEECFDWLDRDLFQPHPNNIELKNFFGKHFIVDRNDLGRKTSRRLELLSKRFYIEGLRIFLYHAFLEPKTKLKNIIYRTPFSLVNFVSEKATIRLDFKLKINQKSNEWSHNLEYKEYYSIPSDIYDSDFLVGISALKRSRNS